MKKRALVFLIVVGLIAAAGLTLHLLPKKYSVREMRSGVFAAWKDDELLIFIDSTKMARQENILEERLRTMKKSGDWGFVLLLLQGRFAISQETVAYHLDEGAAKKVQVPWNSGVHNWTAVHGDFVAMGWNPDSPAWRWNGHQFVLVSRAERNELQIQQGQTRLQVKPDEEDGESYDPYQSLKAAGWHYKHLYASAQQALELPINLKGAGLITLGVAATPPVDEAKDSLEGGVAAGAITISGETLTPSSQTLSAQLTGGWSEISKSEFETMASKQPRSVRPFGGWYLLLVLALLGLRFLPLFAHFLPFLGLKKKILRSVPGQYSFPSAVPEQYPMLDREALERYTRDFEAIGFTRIGDYSLAPTDPARAIPVFVRLFSHPRQQCFAEIGQVFPPGKAPLPFGCAIMSSLEDDWKVTVADRKPQAASVLIRLPRSVSRSFPGTPVAVLFEKFVQFRSQVCADLGIRPLSNATLQDYIADQQKNAALRKETVANRSLTVGLGKYYGQKFGMNQDKECYEWLGDYPKVAAERGSRLVTAGEIG
jgi:hypothetical protein